MPLFLVWLQVSWLIVLVGAEISHAYQRSDHADDTAGGQRLSIRQTRLLCLAICRHVVHRFHQGQPAETPTRIAAAIGLSAVLVDNLTERLVKGGILVRIENDATGEAALQPARDTDGMTFAWVLEALDRVGDNDLPIMHLPVVQRLADDLAAFREILERSTANRRLVDV